VSKPAPPILSLSRKIIEQETAGRTTNAELGTGIEAAFGRLHELMSSLVGTVGFGALIARAIHLTKPSFPWLDST
jgi:hypothetical protein